MDFGRETTWRRLILLGTLLGAFFAFLVFSNLPVFAAAGINQTINFQGRLFDSTGATAPDGFYNIQFKIYQDGDGQSVGNTTGSPAGTLKWTESYLNSASHGVKVQNGFLSVNLGSVTAFGSSIDWNQGTLWLSMNIGNTNTGCTPFSSCSPDGEMVPMQALTSAVYALNAGQLGGLTSSAFGQLAANQVWSGYNTFKPATDSATAFQLQNQSAGTAYVTGDSSNNQLVLGTASVLSGKLAIATAGGGTITVVPTSSASSFTITLPAETGTVCTTATNGVCSTAGTGFVRLGPTSVQTDSTNNNTIFVNKTSGTGNILELQKNGSDVFTIANNGDVSATGTINGDTISSTALTFGGANPVVGASTTNTGLTVRANGTGTLTLNTSGAGTVNLGTTNTTTIGIGSSASTTTLLGVTNINTTGTATTTIGNTGAALTIASTGLNVTSAGAVSGVATLGLSGAITGATTGNTINGLVVNSGALSGISGYTQATGALAFSGGGNFSVDSAAFDVTTAGAVSGVTTLGLSGAITGATSGNTINGLVINSGALSSVTGITTTGGYVQSGSTANTFTGASTFSGGVTITGASNFAVQKGTDFGATGNSPAANFTGSLIRLTGASTQTIQGITGASDGRIITLVNAASQAAVIANQYTTGTTASERIITGTGADITLAPDTAIELRYDTTTSRWRVVGSVGGTSVTTVGAVSGTPTANGATITGNTLSLAVADGSNAGLVSTAAQTFGGVKTFSSNIIAPTSSNTINGLIINAGALSGIAGYTQSTGAFAFSGGGNFSVDSAAFDVTAAGAISGVTTLGLSGAISGATSGNTINGLVVNSGALSSISGYTQASGALAFSGGGNFSVDSAAFDVTAAGAVSGVTSLSLSGAISGGTTLGLSGAITGATSGNTINGLVINSGALSSVTGINTTGGYVQSGSTANTLTGPTTFSGDVTISGAGSYAIQKGTDFSSTATQTAASFTGSLIRLTGSSTQTIQGITGATDGRIITLVNAAGQAAVIANENASASAVNRIKTGTGADINLAPDTSIELRYDSATSRWRVVGGNGTPSISSVGAVSSTPTANGATITGTTLNLAVANGSNAGLVSTTAQTFGGVKTFSNAIIAPTSGDTINGLIISSGALSGIAGYTQSTGAFAFSGGGNFSVDSAGFDVNAAGAVSGVTSLNLSGAITGATTGNTINGLVVNGGSLSSISGYSQATGALAFSGGGNFSVDSAAFDITAAGAVSGVTSLSLSGAISGGTTLGLSGAITGATSGNTINGLVINSGALSSVTGITTNGGYVQSGTTANTLTGATTLSGGLTVTGASSFAVQKGTDFSTTGAQTAASFTGSLIRLTGSSTQTIQGITGASDGRIITLVNAASQAAVIQNQFTTGTVASERIVTGTGADISLAPDASIVLQYDVTTSRWRVIGGVGGTGVTTVGAVSGTPTANGATITGNTLNLAVADGGNAGLVSTTNQTFAGVKTFSSNIIAPTTTNTINGLIINAGALSGIAGYTQSTGAFAFSGGGNFSVDSAAFDVTAAGAVSGVTTLGLSGAITGATSGNTINGLVVSSGALSSVGGYSQTTGNFAFSGGGNFSLDSSGFDVTAAGAVSGVTTLGLSGAITGATSGNTINGLVINSGALSSVAGINTSGGYVQSGSTANTLTGATTFSGGLIVSGTSSFAVQKGTDYSTTGASPAASFAGSLIRLTGSSTQTIQGITGTSDGRIITLVNAAGQSAVIANQSASATSITERIITGSGADLTLPPDASIELRYDTTASRWRVVGGSGAGANVSLSNLSGVAINTSLLPASNNSINVGSNSLTFANGYFGTGVQAPLVTTFDQTAASTASTAITVRSGNASGTGSSSSTGSLTLKSGDSTNGTSGAISIDSGTGGVATGAISIGATNSTSLTVGNTGANTTTLVQGGSTATAIQIVQGNSGTITIGQAGNAAAVNLLCGANATCAIASNATTHTTTIGSSSGSSTTTLQAGSGGLTFTGNITASGTYNGNTFSSTALTFSGANPVLGASTTNTGLSVQANGTGTLTLNTTGAGTINLGTANTTTLGIGNSASTNTILGSTTLTGTVNINYSGTAATTIGTGASTAGDIVVQGGAGTLLSATNSSGTSKLIFSAPSTSGVVSYRLPNGGTGGTTYDICTTQTVCTGYTANGADRALSNLSAVAINTSLLPGVTNSINVGSSALTFANGFFGTSLQSPLFNTSDQSAASTASSSVSFRSGNATGTGSGSSSGGVTIKSGDSTNGSSGNLTIDTGSAGITKGSITIGATATSQTIGNTTAATTVLIQGGTGIGVSLQTAATGTISIGTTNANSVSIGSSNNAGNSLSFGQSTTGETINIGNVNTASGTTAVSILSGNGSGGTATLSLGNNNRVTSISLGNSAPAAARTISIGNTTATANAVIDTINIATNPTTVAGGNTVHIADGTPTGSGTNLVTIGSLANASTTVIQGGTGSNAIQITQATGAGVIIGSPNTGSTVTIQCGAGTSNNCGFGVNGNDHSTYVGSTTGTSNTVIQSGSGGINLNGAVTTSGTVTTGGAINGVTLSSTALTFSGANPVISASTTNTGMTLQANGTGTLALNTGGAGTVNVGTTSTTTIGIGNTTAATQTLINGGTGTSAIGIQTGSGGTISLGTAAAALINIGSNNASTVTTITGGTSGTNALALQVGNGGAINIGTTAQTSVQAIGNTSANTTTLINGGTQTNAIQILQGTGGTVTVGGTGAGSTVTIQCGSGTTTCNLGSNATDHSTILGSTTGTSATTINGGSGGIALTTDTTLSAGKNLTFASGSGRYIQTGFNGTTTDAFAVTATSLTSGAAMRVTSTNANTTNQSFAGNVFNTTNSQATTANTGFIFGTDFEFTQNSSVSSPSVTSAAVNIALAQNNTAPTDNNVTAILNVSNNDTATGNLVQATDGIRINAATSGNITNGIELVGTYGTNLIKSTPYTVTSGGAVSQSGNQTFTGSGTVTVQANAATAFNIQGNGTGSVSVDTSGAGTANFGATNAATVNIGSSNASSVSVACAASATTCGFGTNTTDHTTTVGSTTGSSATNIQGGTSGISLTSGSTVASILSSGMTVRTTTNSATAFRVTNNNSNPVLTVDTSTAGVKIYNGLGGANYLSLTYNDSTTTATIAASAGTTAVGTGTGAISILAGSGSAITVTANAASTWKTTSGNLTLQSGAGTSDNLVLTAGGQVQVSGSTVLKLGSSAGDPGTCTVGAIVYNTTTNTLRGCQGSTPTWNDLVNVTTPTIQQTYTASTGGTTPEIKLDTTRGALDIQGDNGGSVTSLLNVRAGTGSGLGTAVFSVSSTGTTSMQDSTGVDLLTADAANQLVQVGSASAHSTSGIQLVLDNFQSATAGAEPTEIDGAMYYDADSGQFRCAVNGYWQSCSINAIQSSYVFEDEFLSGTTASAATTNVQSVGNLNWNVNATTSCSIAYNQTGPSLTHDHPGSMRFQTSSTNNSGCAMTQAGTAAGTATLSQIISTGDTFKAAVAVGALTGTMRVGWTNQTNNNAVTAGAWWEFVASSDATHLRYCYGNGSAQCAAGPTIAANTWAEVEIHVNSTSSIEFVVNIGGTLNTYNTATAFTATGLGPTFTCYNTNTTQQNCYIDFLQWSGYNTSGDGIRD